MVTAARATAMCNASSFRSALMLVCSHLANTTILPRLGGVDAVSKRYLALAETSRCLPPRTGGDNKPPPDGLMGWPETSRPPDRPIIINAGMGTTGTRFVDRVMSGLGLKVAHNFSPVRLNSLAPSHPCLFACNVIPDGP